MPSETKEEVERLVASWADAEIVRYAIETSIIMRNGELLEPNEFGIGTLIGELASRINRTKNVPGNLKSPYQTEPEQTDV